MKPSTRIFYNMENLIILSKYITLKTEIFVCRRNKIAKPDIKLSEDTLEGVDLYKYLESMVTSDKIYPSKK